MRVSAGITSVVLGNVPTGFSVLYWYFSFSQTGGQQ